MKKTDDELYAEYLASQGVVDPKSTVSDDDLYNEYLKSQGALPMTQPQEMGFGEGLARSAINALPIAGGIGGGVIGAGSGLLTGPGAVVASPAGAAVGAGVGAAAGESLRRGLNSYFFPDEAAKIAEEMKGLNAVEQIGQSFVEPVKTGAEAMMFEGGGQLVSKGLSAGVKAATPKLKSTAERFMAKALGLERGTANKIIREQGVEKINEIGRYGLDNKLLGRTTGVEEALERNEAIKSGLLQSRNQFLKSIDDAGSSTYNAAETATEFQKAFPKPPDYLSNKSSQEAYDKVLTDLMSAGNNPSSIQKADELRKIFGDAGKFEARTASPAAKVYQGAYGKLAEAIDSAGINSAAKAGVDPVSVKMLNNKISTGIGVENILNNAVAKQNNKVIGLTDSIFAAPIFAGGNIAATGATLGAKKAIEKLGNQNIALTLEELTKYSAPGPAQRIMPYLLMNNQNEKDK